MSTNSTDIALQGWTSSPNGRGSLDILWACFATIFLSTWSAICLNVPEVDDTMLTKFKRKAWITFITVMGPEYLLGFALGEWQSANASVVRVRQLRQDDRWTMKHAFFADMGGFSLRTKDGVSFFLDSKQILWLLEHRCISVTEFEKAFLLSLKAIDDRNKSDTFVRVLAVCQALWFVINCIARGVQGLAITTLEITTIGIIVDTIIVYYVWIEKPADVDTTEIVDINMTLNDILMMEEDEASRNKPWFRTPLDFVSQEVWFFNLVYHYLMNILKGMGIHSRGQSKSIGRQSDNDVLPVTGKPFGRRSDNDVLPVTGKPMAVGIFSAFTFIGTNFIAWNFTFPTPTERLLWRVSSCGLAIVCAMGVVVVELFYSVPRVKQIQGRVQSRRVALDQCNAPSKNSTLKERVVYKLQSLAMKIRNNSPEKNSNRDVSLEFVLAGYPALQCIPCFDCISWWRMRSRFAHSLRKLMQQ